MICQSEILTGRPFYIAFLSKSLPIAFRMIYLSDILTGRPLYIAFLLKSLLRAFGMIYLSGIPTGRPLSLSLWHLPSLHAPRPVPNDQIWTLRGIPGQRISAKYRMSQGICYCLYFLYTFHCNLQCSGQNH